MSAKKIKLTEDLKKIKASLATGLVPEQLVPKMQKLQEDLENQLKELEDDKEEEDEKEKEQAKEKEKEDSEKLIAEKAKQKQEKKEATTKKIETAKPSVEECKVIIAEYNAKNRSAIKSKAKSEKKSVSSKVVDGIVRTVSGAVTRELTPAKIKTIEVDFLKEAKGLFGNAIKMLSKALGGIQSKAATDFEKEFQDLIDKVVEMKEKAEKESK